MGDADSFEFVNNIVLVGDEAANADVEGYGFSDFANATFADNVYWAANSTTAAALQNAVSEHWWEYMFKSITR